MNNIYYRYDAPLMIGLKRLILGAVIFFLVLGCWPADVEGQIIYTSVPTRPVMTVRADDTTATVKLLSFEWINTKGRGYSVGDFTLRVLNPEQYRFKACIMVTTEDETDDEQWCTDRPELFKQIGDTTTFKCRQPLTIDAAKAVVSITVQ